MKSWGCAGLPFLPNSLREFCKRAPVLSPPCEGGAGGVGRVTVECTTENKLGAIDGFGRAFAASTL